MIGCDNAYGRINGTRGYREVVCCRSSYSTSTGTRCFFLRGFVAVSMVADTA